MESPGVAGTEERDPAQDVIGEVGSHLVDEPPQRVPVRGVGPVGEPRDVSVVRRAGEVEPEQGGGDPVRYHVGRRAPPDAGRVPGRVVLGDIGDGIHERIEHLHHRNELRRTGQRGKPLRHRVPGGGADEPVRAVDEIEDDRDPRTADDRNGGEAEDVTEQDDVRPGQRPPETSARGDRHGTDCGGRAGPTGDVEPGDDVSARCQGREQIVASEAAPGQCGVLAVAGQRDDPKLGQAALPGPRRGPT